MKYRLISFTIGILILGVALSMTYQFFIPERVPSELRDLVNLRLAIQNYQLTYGCLPFESKVSTPKDILLHEKEYKVLIDCLSYRGKNKGQLNPKGIKFLKIGRNKPFTDKWGNEIRVVLDLDKDQKVNCELVNGYEGEYRLIYNVLLWSLGPDGKEEIPFTSNKNGYNKDNIYWK